MSKSKKPSRLAEGLKESRDLMRYAIKPKRTIQGLVLRELRRGRGLTLQEVSAQTGISLSTIQALETGRGKNYNVTIKHTLADFFEVDFFALWPEERERIEQIMGKGRTRQLFAPAEGQGEAHK